MKDFKWNGDLCALSFYLSICGMSSLCHLSICQPLLLPPPTPKHWSSYWHKYNGIPKYFYKINYQSAQKYNMHIFTYLKMVTYCIIQDIWTNFESTIKQNCNIFSDKIIQNNQLIIIQSRHSNQNDSILYVCLWSE